MAKEGWFPRYLISPTQVFWWESDEVFPFMALWFLGFVFGQMLLLGMLGFAMSWLIIKNKEYLPDGFLSNVMYFVGFKKLDGYPLYIQNEFKE